MSIAISFHRAVPPSEPQRRLTPLSLEVPGGSLCVIQTVPALSGPLLRACVGLLSLGSGRVQVLGTDPAHLDRRRVQQLRHRLGVGLRPGGLTANQTLRTNVAIPLLYSGVAGPQESLRRADTVLDECGLGFWADRRPDDAPPDVRQGAVIARAIARRPELLLLEDPFSAVDSIQAERLLSVCRRTAGSILIATQHVGEVLGPSADLSISWNLQPREPNEAGAN